MSKTETVETMHGAVEYSVAECDSCGLEVREEDTVPFEIGDREGVACEECADVGPADFPVAEDPSGWLIPVITLAWPLALLSVWLHGDRDLNIITVGLSLGAMLWTAIALFVLVTFGGVA